MSACACGDRAVNDFSVAISMGHFTLLVASTPDLGCCSTWSVRGAPAFEYASEVGSTFLPCSDTLRFGNSSCSPCTPRRTRARPSGCLAFALKWHAADLAHHTCITCLHAFDSRARQSSPAGCQRKALQTKAHAAMQQAVAAPQQAVATLKWGLLRGGRAAA